MYRSKIIFFEIYCYIFLSFYFRGTMRLRAWADTFAASQSRRNHCSVAVSLILQTSLGFFIVLSSLLTSVHGLAMAVIRSSHRISTVQSSPVGNGEQLSCSTRRHHSARLSTPVNSEPGRRAGCDRVCGRGRAEQPAHPRVSVPRCRLVDRSAVGAAVTHTVSRSSWRGPCHRQPSECCV